jgi:hypothetical protein
VIPFEGRESLGPPRLLSRKDLIAVILRLQLEGWQRALEHDPALSPHCDETYMNGRLYQGMVSVRASLGLTNVFIVETPGVRHQPDPPLPEGEPDVIMLFAEFGANEPHAIIECKRLDPLENPRRLRREYVRSGIDRFIAGLYGSGHDIDFMVAYVLRGDGPAAMDDVNAHLQNVRRCGDLLHATDEFRSAAFIARSDHLRTFDARRFRLLHSFVGFQDSTP